MRRERYQVALGRTWVVVVDDKDLAHILPLLTMTGITYLKPRAKRQAPTGRTIGCRRRCFTAVGAP